MDEEGLEAESQVEDEILVQDSFQAAIPGKLAELGEALGQGGIIEIVLAIEAVISSRSLTSCTLSNLSLSKAPSLV